MLFVMKISMGWGIWRALSVCNWMSEMRECLVWPAFGLKSWNCTNTDLKMEGENWMEGQSDTKPSMDNENMECVLYFHGAAVKVVKPKSH